MESVKPKLKSNTVGGVIGNTLEWYDFAVFGYFAPIIGMHFFPGEDQLATLINAFGVFAAGYLMRPIGGVILGQLGDRVGRKRALEISVIMMAIPTTLLGLLPSYASIGVTASLLLVLLRLVQGFSVGGELIGSISYVSEIAPAKHRGLYGSWAFSSSIAGVMFGSLVATVLHNVLPPEDLNAWGWRLPFLMGILIGLFGLWMRKGMEESPEFTRIEKKGEITISPVVEVIKTMPFRIIHVAALVALMGSGFYILFVWWPTYLSNIITPPIEHAFLVNTISMAVFMALVPLYGWLSDRIGRRGILVAAALGFIFLSYPLFIWTDHTTFVGALIAQLIFAVMMAGTEGPMPAVMVETFPTRTRFSGVAIGYNLTLSIVGGTAPLFSTWIIKVTGDMAAPAWYLTALALISLIASFLWVHPQGKDLE